MHVIVVLKFTAAYRGPTIYYVRHPELEAVAAGHLLVKPARAKTEDV